ncbi:hypothetical protein [Komagataeibacter medellinensis]|uniref:Uncharacterized protein n=1 Tax=Komagataeibacter medellinensis (strain NBRC 3288 / BCRC 11682 / LMG 1693 / Kondo 51) TaxID=634177 RepID=G2I2N1_KOMMN|nr:hypothetical protein [Komagataeibacter medellinensis]BAK85010.1 hypothetical protein GLX_25980 [Komagataeibacter medellinensis NBRC 3288]
MSDRGASSGPNAAGFGGILKGMLLLGRGRAEGIAYFGGTRDSVLSALAPRLALWLVLGGLTIGYAPQAISGVKVLFALCLILLPAVVTQALAHHWKREALWLRYITATWWTDWVTLFVGLVVALLMALASPRLLQSAMGAAILNGVEFAYSLWLTWYVARIGLLLRRRQAVVLVLAILGSLGLLVLLTGLSSPGQRAWHEFLYPMLVQQGAGH